MGYKWVCSNDFWDLEDLDDHKDDHGHWNCETCNRYFKTIQARNQHMSSLNHWAQRYKCETNDYQYLSENPAVVVAQHMMMAFRFKGHFCMDCQREFQDENALKMHLRSRIHLKSTIPCPFCKQTFTTATGVAHHLERSSCPEAKNLSRAAIHAQVALRDPKNLITIRQFDHSPDANSRISVSDRCWNGQFYECYLCHREFGSMQALDQHVNSGTHHQKIYHCPGVRCIREFASLAALFNHLESESCGAVRFETVQRSVQNIVGGDRKIQSR
ncbi:putative zinc finger protein [Massariosphaeria phaeospora]|uniref:Putative zinc finger protein n=1 Tax=Massariosphaeria phaeospora TaxID=100035 RepID=A0A7C8I6S6_9PLEO|nr:putative zinc finger protein [Massariosphaeria phaeospora]